MTLTVDSPQFQLLEEYNAIDIKLDRDKTTTEEIKVITGKVNCPQLAKLLIEADNRHYIVLADNLTIYSWNGAYHEPNGEHILGERINHYLDDLYSDYKRKEVISCIKNLKSIKIKREKLNSPPEYLIPVLNGVYDRKKKKLIQHSPENLFLYQIPIKYNPKAKIKKIKEFFDDLVTVDDLPVLQEFFGDCLQPTYKYKKALMNVGKTDTGKSQLLSLLGKFLGNENTSHVALYDLCKDRFAAIDLYGKIANICADIDATGIRATKVFLMVTGGDIIRGQKKHQDAFDFRNYAKLVYSCNEIPESENKSPAYYNRWLIIEYDNQIPKEEQIPYYFERISTSKELSGLFNWALDGLKRLEKNGYSEHRTLEEVKDFMELHQKPIPIFAITHVEIDPDGEMTKDFFYKQYCDFCDFFKYPKKTSNVFSREIKQYLPRGWDEGQSRKKKSKRVWRGIKCNWERGKTEQKKLLEEKQEEG
jgi:P4 family phage/plasmid primase-like protien